ncbi:hypothetical protein ACFE04_014303 [Oxalis oulophora]
MNVGFAARRLHQLPEAAAAALVPEIVANIPTIAQNLSPFAPAVINSVPKPPPMTNDHQSLLSDTEAAVKNPSAATVSSPPVNSSSGVHRQQSLPDPTPIDRFRDEWGLYEEIGVVVVVVMERDGEICHG